MQNYYLTAQVVEAIGSLAAPVFTILLWIRMERLLKKRKYTKKKS